MDFADLCGFVQAKATYGAGPGSLIWVDARRNGVKVSDHGQQVPSPTPIFHYAEDGDTITWAWELADAKHTAQHTHRTPANCDEPKLSFRVRDDCTAHSTLVIGNDGKGLVNLSISSDTAFNTLTVPPGGAELPIVGGLVDPGSSKRISVFVPHPTEQFSAVPVAEVRRSACDGIPMAKPENPQSFFEATCTGKVSILWINGEKAFEGVLRLYRNGSPALEETVAAGGVYQFQLDVAEGDVIAVGGPDGPHGTYTYRQATCAGTNQDAVTLGGLPTTGVAVGSLILGAVALVGVGLLVRRAARRRQPRY